MAAFRAGSAEDGAFEPRGGQRIVGIAGEIAGQEFEGVDQDARATVLDGADHFLAADHGNITADDEIGAAGGDANGVDVLEMIGDANIAVDGATLLRQARHVDDAEPLAL